MERAEVEQGLESFIHRNSGARAVRIENASRVSGGASRETWTWDADLEYDDRVERIPGILRAEPSKGYEPSISRKLEYWVIKAAWDAGARVPEPLWDGDETFERTFMTMKRVEGETLGPRLVRGEQYAGARKAFAGQLAESIARIHSIDISHYPQLAQLPRPEPGTQPAATVLANIQASFRGVAKDPHPVFELAFRWLADRLPRANEPVFVHGDFRLGNVIFDEAGLRAVIDWEAAHLGDPMEDLAWVMMRSWRFGGTKEGQFQLSGGGQVVGWLNRKMFDETGDVQKSQGWTPLVMDTNGNGRRDACGLGRGQGSVAPQDRRQVLAVHVLHDDERAARVLAVVVDRDDVGVAQRGGVLGLLAKARTEIGVPQVLGSQELDGDLATELGVQRSIDGRHAALPERRDHIIATAQDRPDLCHVPSGLRRGASPSRRRVSGGMVPHHAVGARRRAPTPPRAAGP